MPLFLGGLLIMAGLFFFKAFQEFTTGSSEHAEPSKGLGFVFVVSGIACLLGAAFVLFRILTM